MFNTVADLLCALLHSLHMGKYVAIQGNRSPCCVMRFIVVSFVHVPTVAKRHACRLDVGWIIVWGLAIYGRTQSGCLELRPIPPLPQNVRHRNGCGFGTSSCVSAVKYTSLSTCRHYLHEVACNKGDRWGEVIPTLPKNVLEMNMHS